MHSVCPIYILLQILHLNLQTLFFWYMFCCPIKYCSSSINMPFSLLYDFHASVFEDVGDFLICSIFYTLIRCMKFIHRPKYAIWYVILLYSNYRHVSATDVANFRVIPTHYKYTCILALSSVKMEMWVDETCRWSPYIIKLHFIKPKCICLSFNKFYAKWWLFWIVC